MGKFIKIALVSGVIALAVVAVFLSVKYKDGFTTETGVSGPTVQAYGLTWDTTLIVNDNPEHSKFAVHAIFEAPEGFDPQDPPISFKTLVDLCEVVVANLEEFDQGGLDFDAVHHIDLNLRIGKYKAFPFDPSMLLENGVCTDRLYFMQSDREVMQTASNHDPQAETNAILASWGTHWAGVKYATGNKGRVIEVQYAITPSYKRQIKDFDFRALCIRALMDMSSEVNLFVTKIDPSSYDKLEMKLLASKSSVGGVVTTSKFGTATFALDNGTCGEVVKS